MMMPYRHYSGGHVLYSEHYNFPVNIQPICCSLNVCICLNLLCTVLCMYECISTALVFYIHWIMDFKYILLLLYIYKLL